MVIALLEHFPQLQVRRIVSQFIEELSFFGESDKGWVMGRAIVADFNWT